MLNFGRSPWYIMLYVGAVALVMALAYPYILPGARYQLTPAEREFLDRLERPLVLVSDAFHPPFAFLDENGTARGYEVDLAEAISRRLGIEVDLRLLPWTEALNALERGEADAAAGMRETPERERQVLFTRPYLHTSFAAVISPLGPRIESAEDLDGLRVAHARDSATGAWLEATSGIVPVPAESSAHALQLLAAGRVDAWVECHLVARHLLGRAGLREEFTVYPLPGTGGEYAIAVHPDLPALRNILDKVLHAMEVQGELEDLDRRWFGIALSRLRIPRGTVVALVLGFTGLLSACLALALYSVYLKRRVEVVDTSLANVEQRLLKGEAGLRRTLLGIATAFGQVVDERDPFRTDHSLRVAAVSARLAKALGLPGDKVEWIRIGALLHDVGRLAMPRDRLGCPGPLSEEERDLVRIHPDSGASFLAPVHHLRPVINVVMYHHERWDGRTGTRYSGYPGRLKGKSIPLEARIVAVADAWVAMRSDRPHRPALSRPAALRELRAGAGSQFDPAVVEAFARLLSATDEGCGASPLE